ncbi:axonemal dynein intermediate chain inner arm i1 [Reticulomyxa filosa]|uniref:Dynein axonemal intermediate chain 4 n=1 Tax=Reticulomyxa filosa TaxID=46433 RepID=X6LLT4_RETFI|nr:axonemal dynein intermediate chain inner arm i1 [Reticulomyxa filosa]|eukprot:ETO02107.1 axonemal dynein intermediate chain inner arm i1 [Reticulomyxa filosa]
MFFDNAIVVYIIFCLYSESAENNNQPEVEQSKNITNEQNNDKRDVPKLELANTKSLPSTADNTHSFVGHISFFFYLEIKSGKLKEKDDKVDEEMIVNNDNQTKPEKSKEEKPSEREVVEETQRPSDIDTRPSQEHKDDTNSEGTVLPHLRKLFTFATAKTNNLPCSAIDINPGNKNNITYKKKDLIVAGYGSTSFGNTDQGKIMFWTLKNPYNPERIYECGSSVCSLNFSTSHPSLLAVGLFDGNVCVYDLRMSEKSRDAPLVHSELGSCKHSTPVWNVLWEKPIESRLSNLASGYATPHSDKNKNGSNFDYDSSNSSKLHQRQKLFSISSDGLVKQWSMKKGFYSQNIMTLKRIPNLASLQGSVLDNTIRSCRGSGMCFDFPNGPTNTQYYVGTEDGIVHKQTNNNHISNFNKYLTCSPFDSDKFLTCSNDWTIKIWNEHLNTPCLDLCPGSQSIIDVCWSPFDSCVFASSSQGGKIQVWDIHQSKKDPIITHLLTSSNTPSTSSQHVDSNDPKSNKNGVENMAINENKANTECITTHYKDSDKQLNSNNDSDKPSGEINDISKNTTKIEKVNLTDKSKKKSTPSRTNTKLEANVIRFTTTSQVLLAKIDLLLFKLLVKPNDLLNYLNFNEKIEIIKTVILKFILRFLVFDIVERIFIGRKAKTINNKVTALPRTIKEKYLEWNSVNSEILEQQEKNNIVVKENINNINDNKRKTMYNIMYVNKQKQNTRS